jgi:hypothetical protein
LYRGGGSDEDCGEALLVAARIEHPGPDRICSWKAPMRIERLWKISSVWKNDLEALPHDLRRVILSHPIPWKPLNEDRLSRSDHCLAARSFDLVCEEYNLWSSGGLGYSGPQHEHSRGIEYTARIASAFIRNNDNEETDPLFDEDFTIVEVRICCDSPMLRGTKFCDKNYKNATMACEVKKEEPIAIIIAKGD